MKHIVHSILFSIYICFLGCSSSKSNEFEHVAGIRMVLHDERVAGFSDRSFVYLYEYEDDDSINAVIRKWSLSQTKVDDIEKDGRSPLSVYSAWKDKSSLWPTKQELQKIPESYYRFDWDAELYWSLWVDRDNHKIYAEMGNW